MNLDLLFDNVARQRETNALLRLYLDNLDSHRRALWATKQQFPFAPVRLFGWAPTLRGRWI